MSVSSDVAEQLVRLSISGMATGLKLVGSGAVHSAQLLRSLSKNHAKSSGKIRMQNLLRTEKQIKIFTIPVESLAAFCLFAKQYGLLYSVVKEKGAKEGTADIFVKASDAIRVNRILERMETEIPDVHFLEKENQVKVRMEEEQQKVMERKEMGDLQGMDDKESIVKALFTKPQVQRNPEEARTSMAHPSVPLSESSNALAEGFSNRPPSVKKELEELSKQLYKTAKQYERSLLNGEPQKGKETTIER